MLAKLLAQPLYAPIAGRIEALLRGGDMPTAATLTALAAEAGLVSGGGRPLSFVVPGGSGLAYEERVYWLGEVETRAGNWHDFLNAVVWLAFPRTKAALNRRHHLAHAARQAAGESGRGPLRDALTQFDECGAAVVCADPSLWEDLRGHRWQRLFWQRRAETIGGLRVFVVGHASYDILRTPHVGLCAKALCLNVDEGWLAQPFALQTADVDARLAQRFAGELPIRPRDFQPLPLLGIPGATPDNEYPAYYDDTRQFRPLRAVR